MGKYCGDTGNWDPNDNHYWVDFRCEDCGKQWSEEQQKEVHYDSTLKQMVTKDGIPFVEVKRYEY